MLSHFRNLKARRLRSREDELKCGQNWNRELRRGGCKAMQEKTGYTPGQSGAKVSQTLEPALLDLVCSKGAACGDGYGRSTMLWDYYFGTVNSAG